MHRNYVEVFLLTQKFCNMVFYLSLEKYKQVINQEFIKDIDFMDDIIKKLNLNKNAKILDIGTGIGAMSILLAINGFDVLTGEPEEDPERDSWEHNEHHHEGEHECNHHEHFESDWEDWGDWRESAKILRVEDKIKFQHFDTQALPFSDQSFDGIFMYDTLQHIKERKLALNECLRVMKPIGVLCVIEFSEKTIKEEKEKCGYDIDFIDPSDYLKLSDISIEKNLGNWVNFYIIRKN